MSKTEVAAGIDIGGTQMKMVGVGSDGVVHRKGSAETHDRDMSPPEKIRYWEETIRSFVEGLAADGDIEVTAVGLAAPGIVHPGSADRAIANMPGRLAGLEGLDWTEHLTVGHSIAITNDAQAALLSEAWIGSAAGFQNAVLLTLGTGVGGAAMLDGRIVRGTIGRAAHFGHMSLDIDGPPDICRTPGSLEWFVGDANASSRSSGRFASNEEILAAHRNGDVYASYLWHRSMRALACGVASVVNLFDPQVVILGGGLVASWSDVYEPLKREMDEVEWRPHGAAIEIRSAALGSFAGAIGAAKHALEIADTRS